MDQLIHQVAQLDPAWIYLTIFLIAFIENIFPPAPSDVLVVFGGALAGMEKGNFVIAFLSGAAGGTLGFMVMFGIGKWFGKTILEQGKLKFIKLEDLHKLEKWFQKWGLWLIVANRFLSGTRAVISFFAGISELDFKKTTILSFISSLLWYLILVSIGYSLGQHWGEVNSLLKTYSLIVTIVIIIFVLIAVLRFYYHKKHPR
ncbi:MAG: DedA family protein [Ignavibacteriales bacterium]|nr:DedA family protein [Ignavibacteriales bacterium]